MSKNLPIQTLPGWGGVGGVGARQEDGHGQQRLLLANLETSGLQFRGSTFCNRFKSGKFHDDRTICLVDSALVDEHLTLQKYRVLDCFQGSWNFHPLFVTFI